MGLNVDNLFVKSDQLDLVEAALNRVVQGHGSKFALSVPRDNWIQVIESHEATPPDIAQSLSRELPGTVICAQVYQTSGDGHLAIYRNGVLVESVRAPEHQDPYSFIKTALGRAGITAGLRMFREVVRDGEWTIRKGTPNQAL